MTPPDAASLTPPDLARQRLAALRESPDPIVLAGDAKLKFVDCLDVMLGGDPWQEGQYAIEIVGLIA